MKQKKYGKHKWKWRIEMVERMKEKNAYDGNGEWTRHLEYGFSKMSVGGPPFESSQLTQDKT